MINDLRYAVTFPTNGVSLAGEISFQPGTTAITGDNGAGKSFVAEMIRYGLFGKKALRGPASDYKTLDMALTFAVGETSYAVSRAKKEELVCFDGDEVLAVGADAVNKKIVELLGFELEVFDVVCIANQKESERLTKLTPARRKELIDDVVGLTAQEAVEKACKDEAKGLAREAEALNRQLVPPVEPMKPEGYRPSTDLQVELQAAQVTNERRAVLQRIVDAVGTEPVEPDEQLNVSIEDLESHEKERGVTNTRGSVLDSQARRIADPVYTAEQLDAAEALAAYDADVARRGPRPDYRERELVDWGGVWARKAQLSHNDATCPNCQHHFLLDAPDVDIAAVEALPTPPISMKEIEAQVRRHDAWINEPVEPKGDRLTATQISTGRMALAMAEEKQRLIAELYALPALEDKSAELVAARRLDREWHIYESAFKEWADRAARASDAKVELDKTPPPATPIGELSSLYTEARVYEQQLVRYQSDRERFDELAAQIAEKQERADAFTAGAKGLVEARRTLKAFLAPSLSRVASKIIRQMTESSLRPLDSIEVDEDMNITANGQDVSTFNGAHGTMINLALRLALGQVLVARVFPVFIGDEIDSDATPANAQAIADGLMACKDQLKQIVLISHKRLDGVDHEVML